MSDASISPLHLIRHMKSNLFGPGTDYTRQWRLLLVIASIVVFPPLGVIVLWCSKCYSTRAKQVWTSVGAMWFFMLVGGDSGGMFSLAVWSALCVTCIFAWRRWGTRLEALLRRHDEYYADLNGSKIKRQVHLALIVVLLVAFAPLAVVVAALSRRFSAREKIAVAVASVFWMLALVGIIAGAGSSTHGASRVVENSVAPASTPTPPDPEAEAREIVEKIAKQSFGGPATVDVYQRPEGAVGAGFYSVEAHYKTISASKGYIVPEIRRFYVALYTSSLGPKIWDAWVWANTDLVDKYGHETEDLIYKTALDRDGAGKINWKNTDMVDFPSVWKESYISRSLTELLPIDVVKCDKM